MAIVVVQTDMVEHPMAIRRTSGTLQRSSMLTKAMEIWHLALMLNLVMGSGACSQGNSWLRPGTSVQIMGHEAGRPLGSWGRLHAQSACSTVSMQHG